MLQKREKVTLNFTSQKFIAGFSSKAVCLISRKYRQHASHYPYTFLYTCASMCMWQLRIGNKDLLFKILLQGTTNDPWGTFNECCGNHTYYMLFSKLSIHFVWTEIQRVLALNFIPQMCSMNTPWLTYVMFMSFSDLICLFLYNIRHLKNPLCPQCES